MLQALLSETYAFSKNNSVAIKNFEYVNFWRNAYYLFSQHESQTFDLKVGGGFCEAIKSFNMNCCVACLKKGINHIERFQGLTTRMIKRLHHLNFIKRLQHLKLSSHEKRRQRMDLIVAYGIIHGRFHFRRDEFFTLPVCSYPRVWFRAW